MLKLKCIAEGPCHFPIWGWEWYPHFLAGSFLYLVLQPSEAWCKVLFSSELCWLLDSLGILVTKLYLMRKYEKIRWIYSLKYFSYMSCSRVKLGDFSSISTVLFSMVLISELLEFIIWGMSFPSLGSNLIYWWIICIQHWHKKFLCQANMQCKG